MRRGALQIALTIATPACAVPTAEEIAAAYADEVAIPEPGSPLPSGVRAYSVGSASEPCGLPLVQTVILVGADVENDETFTGFLLHLERYDDEGRELCKSELRLWPLDDE